LGFYVTLSHPRSTEAPSDSSRGLQDLMTLASLSVIFCIVLHLCCVSSDQVVAIPVDMTMLMQYQITTHHGSLDDGSITSEHLAANLLPILTNLPNMSKIAALDPDAICNQMKNYISPLMSWLSITLTESSQQIDTVLNEHMVLEDDLLAILRNKTLSVNRQLRMAEVFFSKGLLPGGVMDTKLMEALAPMNLGGSLHLGRYRVATPSISWNATFHHHLMKNLIQKVRAGFNETDWRERENAKEAIKQLNASMEAGMAQMGSRGRAVGVSLANLTGTLTRDMGAVMPIECLSVYEKPIGDANSTIDGLRRNIKMKLTKLTSGVREATKLFMAT